MAISKKVADRITSNLKRYQAILADAKDRDVSESDTVVIIADILADVLGYNKYTELTTEFAIRNTYVDLAVKVGQEIRFLIEAKAVGVALKDPHIKQAVDYGANHGIEWIVLTNGTIWQIYKIHFKQPIEHSLIYECDLLGSSHKDPKLSECLWHLSKEGFAHSSMTAFYQQQQATSRFALAAVLLSDTMISALRRELRRITPNIRVEEGYLKTALETEVLKREVVESEEAKKAFDYLKRAVKAAERVKKKESQSGKTNCEGEDTKNGPPIEDYQKDLL